MNVEKKVIHRYRMHFIFFMIMFTFLIFLFLVFFKRTFSSLVADADVKINVANAVYILEEGMFDFYIDLEGIVPSEDPYVYSFTVANYNDKKRSDVDIDYQLSLLATTNLPLKYELYRNELYTDDGAVDIIRSNDIVSDLNGAWYRELSVGDTYRFTYDTDMMDTYYLIIYYPKSYSSNIEYQGVAENIEVRLQSKQVIEEDVS